MTDSRSLRMKTQRDIPVHTDLTKFGRLLDYQAWATKLAAEIENLLRVQPQNPDHYFTLAEARATLTDYTRFATAESEES